MVSSPVLPLRPLAMPLANASFADAAALESLGNEESTAEKLDERLCYLMRVHGIDYYRRCQEMNPVTFLERVTMTSAFSKRDPKPETPVATIAQNPTVAQRTRR